MNNEAPNAEEDDVIEASQALTLRKNVRNRKIFYGETSFSKPSDAKRRKKRPAKQRNIETVSQCMEQEWKRPRIWKRAPPGTKESNIAPRTQCDVEEYLKFSTQQDVAQELDYVPSVNLFEQQSDVIHQYMLNETSEAQQEEMLDRMLQGFRTSYEQASARIMTASPVANTSPVSVNILENVPNAESNEGNLYEPLVQIIDLPREPRVERDEVQPMVIDGCLDLSARRDKTSRDNAYCARNEIIHKRQLVLNNHFNERMYAKNNYDNLDLHMIPSSAEQRINRGRELVSKCCQQQQQPKQIEQSSGEQRINRGSDLVSKCCQQQQQPKQIEQSSGEQRIKRDRELVSKFCQQQQQPKQIEQSSGEQRINRGRDLVSKCCQQQQQPKQIEQSSGEQRINRGRELVSKCCQQQQQPKQIEQSSYKATMNVSTAEHATQTRTKFSRNAGIQHRPVASFDMSKYNVITLARMSGSNPDSVYSNLKNIMATSYPRNLWHARNLSQVFTQDDPYYANLEYFMNPRH